MVAFENIICDYAFYFSLIVFCYYLHKSFKYSRFRKREVYNNCVAHEEQYITDDRLKTLYTMYETITAQEESAQEKIDRINYLNQYGSIVNEKNKKRAENELYRIQQRKISIENQINEYS